MNSGIHGISIMDGRIRQILVLGLVLFLLTCSTTQGQQLPIGCRLDVCFIMDESGSIGDVSWNTAREFVANFTSLLPFGTDPFLPEIGSRVGIVLFSADAEIYIKLKDYAYNKEALIGYIREIPYGDGSATRIDLGLEEARTVCFQDLNGDRSSAPNIAVLMTDGKSPEETAIDQAEQLRATGATIVVIGIGSNVDHQLLLSIAADEENLFFVDDFDDLYENIHKILGRTCDAALNCAGGQLNDWTDDYPRLWACPHLTNPTVVDDKYVTFYCGFNYTVPDPLPVRQAKFEVAFLFDGIEQFTEVYPPRTYEERSGFQYAELHERHLYGNIGKYISCRVQTYIQGRIRSPEIVSRSYWCGIAFSHEFVNVFEADGDPQTVLAYSTLPAACKDDNTDCDITLEVYSGQSIAVFQNQQGLARMCTYKFEPRNWLANESIAIGYPLQILPQRDPLGGVSRTANITFKAEFKGIKHTADGAFYLDPWVGYTTSNITVFVHDNPPATCRSIGDPSITTFDGRRFTADHVGLFTYVEDTDHIFEVQVQHFGCGSHCSVACGVALRDPSGIAILNACSGSMSPPQICDNGFSGSITGDTAANHYKIKSQTGVTVEVIEINGGINVIIKIPASFRQKTAGVCGSFDGNPNNDITGSIKDFVNDWRVDEPGLMGCEWSDDGGTASSSQSFCNCMNGGHDMLLNLTNKCGLDALEDPIADLADPLETVLAFIPGFLKDNANPPGVRSRRKPGAGSGNDSRTDNIDDEYFPVFDNKTYGDEDPPPWGTFGISEVEAIDNCTQVLANSASYSVCGALVSEADFQIIVTNCVSDIQRTGDLIWTVDKIFEYQDQCVQTIFNDTFITHRDDPMSDPAFGPVVASFVNTTCPDSCSGQGVCNAGKCICDQGYLGVSCSMTEGTQPSVTGYLGPHVCDVQERLCQNVKVTANHLIFSPSLTCRVHVQQNHGSASIKESKAVGLTANRVQCSLPDLLTMELGGYSTNTQAAYTYTVKLSNDGVEFVSVPDDTTRLVMDSTCMDCLSDGTCVQKTGTCMIKGQCFVENEEKGDFCYMCLTGYSNKEWTVDPDLPTPSLTLGHVLVRTDGEHLYATLEAHDPLAKSINFNLISGNSGDIKLNSYGQIEWTPSSNPSEEITVRMTADGCPRSDTADIRLIILPCDSICGGHGKCLPDPDEPRGQGYYICDCDEGFSGVDCEINLDECVSSPCVHGQCIDGADSYLCSCVDGYTGTHCQLPVGLLGPWEDFTACSKECDYGMRSRNRECLTPPCEEHLLGETILCNDFSCPVIDSEIEEGGLIVMKKIEMLQVVQQEGDLLTQCADILNVHCQNNPETCCQSVGLVHISSEVDTVFRRNNVRTASGSPLYLEENQAISLRILVDLDVTQIGSVCRAASEQRVKRQSQDVRTVDKIFIQQALQENTHIFSKEFGIEVYIDDEVEDVDEKEVMLKRVVAPVSVVAGVLLIILLTFVILLAKTREKPNVQLTTDGTQNSPLIKPPKSPIQGIQNKGNDEITKPEDQLPNMADPFTSAGQQLQDWGRINPVYSTPASQPGFVEREDYIYNGRGVNSGGYVGEPPKKYLPRVTGLKTNH